MTLSAIRSLLVLGATALLAAFPASSLGAQATFQACRVPSVGAIYIIGVPNAPTACLDPSHVAFSWTEGGAPADGSVTTAKLANGAVTSGKLAAGSVGAAAVADNSITPDKLAAEPGVAVGRQVGNIDIAGPFSGTWTTITSVTITIPRAGLIVVRGHAWSQIRAAGSGSIWTQINTTDSGAGFAANGSGAVGTTSTGETNNWTTSVMEVFVRSAGTHTFYFQGTPGSASATGQNMFISRGVLVAEYFPTSY